MESKAPGNRTLLAFIVSTIFVGGNAIAIRYSNVEFPPFFGSALRFFLASAIFFLLVFFMRLPLPKGRALIGAVVFGALQFGISYAFIYWSLESVPPGKFQVILAIVPLFTFIFAMFQHQEKFQWRLLIGSLLSLVGIAIIFRGQLVAKTPLLPMLGIVPAAAGFAEASVYFKTVPKSHPITTNAIAMATGAIILMFGSLITHESIHWPKLENTWLALAYLVVFGSIGGFALVLYVLSHWTASAANYQLVLVPIVTVALSSWLTKEKITPNFVIGGILVLLGVLIGALIPPIVLSRFFKRTSSRKKFSLTT